MTSAMKNLPSHGSECMVTKSVWGDSDGCCSLMHFAMDQSCMAKNRKRANAEPSAALGRGARARAVLALKENGILKWRAACLLILE